MKVVARVNRVRGIGRFGRDDESLFPAGLPLVFQVAVSPRALIAKVTGHL